MTMVEIERLTVIKALSRGEITAGIASLRLGLGTRQVKRLLDRFTEAGAPGLISRQRGRPSNRQLVAGLAEKALAIVREHYADYGPTLAAEKLKERHDIKLATETVRQLMIEDGLWKTREQQRARLHQPRTRRNCLGDLIQIDGSLHPWFEERGPTCSLLVYVDDATGRLMQLHFAPTESAMSYFEATRKYIVKHGKPHTFYSDRAGVFRSLRQGKQQNQTQFHRALTELDIDLICASSPQAKGRVERMNRTLQDRLVKELRLHEISTIDEANASSDMFVEDYNRRFERMPRQPINLHRPLGSDDDLSRILAWRDERKLTSKLTLQNKDWLFVLEDKENTRDLIGHQITIHTSPDGTVQICADGRQLAHVPQPIARKLNKPIEVDSKSLHYTLDQIRQPRKRGYNPTTAQKQKDLAEAKALASKNRNLRKKAAEDRKKSA